MPVYLQIASVREIVLVASDAMHAELHRRSGEQWTIELVRGSEAVLSLASAGVSIPFAELYDDIALANGG